jgi:plastocyanin
MKKVAVAFALVIASVALVACGSSSSSSSTETTATETPSESSGAAAGESKTGEAEGGSASSASTLKIEAAPSGLAYTSKTATAKAGKVTVDFNNPQPLEHDVAIESSSGEMVGETELVAEGESSTEVTLKPGTYKFFCTVPGHREAGMEGTLTVK